jgi:hypothetical protein
MFRLFRVLTKESFQGLFLLQSLYIHDLPDLKRFDADSLSGLTYLSSLHIQAEHFTRGNHQAKGLYITEIFYSILDLDLLS